MQTASKPQTRINILALITDPILGWALTLGLGLCFGIGAMYFEDRSLTTLIFAGFYGLAAHGVLSILPKELTPQIRFLDFCEKALWFGVIFAVTGAYSELPSPLDGAAIAQKALMAGGGLALLGAFFMRPQPAKFDTMYKDETTLDAKNGFAFLVLVWPFLTAILGLSGLFGGVAPFWVGLLVLTMMSIAPQNRLPVQSLVNRPSTKPMTSLRIMLIVLFVAMLTWLQLGITPIFVG